MARIKLKKKKNTFPDKRTDEYGVAVIIFFFFFQDGDYE